ncbi:MAG: hypothetical protein K2N78_08080, partial [Oscillospiraceae bacterium]|nr:hypothetical protein [Oscillospiraceae bacterium]
REMLPDEKEEGARPSGRVVVQKYAFPHFRRPSCPSIQLIIETIAQFSEEVKTNQQVHDDLWKFHSGGAEKESIICMFISCVFFRKMVALT